MSFYGKIYEQASNIFNQLKFKNISSQNFPSSVDEEFTLTADGGQACAVMAAGNPWIQFKEDTDERQPDGSQLGCKIYHSLPHDPGSTGFAHDYIECAIQEQERNSELSDFLKLTSESHNILTQTEKDALKALDNDTNLLYFGDTFKTWSPIRDNAGHIVKFDEKTWQIGPLPRILDVLKSENRIDTLEEVVGVTGYDDSKGSISTRVTNLESDFVEVGEKANQAAQDASDAASDAADALAQAQSAEGYASAAASSAQAAADSVTAAKAELQGNIDKLSGEVQEYDSRITNITNAIGSVDDEVVMSGLGNKTLLEWSANIEAIIGETELDNIKEDFNESSLIACLTRIKNVIGEDYNEYDPEEQTYTLSAQIQANADAIAEGERELANKAPSSLVDAVGASTSTIVQDEIGAASLIAWAKSINNITQVTLVKEEGAPESGSNTISIDLFVLGLFENIKALKERVAELEELAGIRNPDEL